MRKTVMSKAKKRESERGTGGENGVGEERERNSQEKDNRVEEKTLWPNKIIDSY